MVRQRCARSFASRLLPPAYWQTVPGAHCALKEPLTLTVPVPPTSAPVKENVPRIADGEELVMTSCPDVELNSWIVGITVPPV